MKMLAVLPVPPTYLSRYESIRDSKAQDVRRRLAPIHPVLSTQFDAYLDAMQRGRLHLLQADAQCATRAADLRSCYNGPTAALRVLKTAIEACQAKRALQRCPMCGTTLPSTYDHYLPAELFPEFSVFPLNIVPCCSSCNSRKRHDWLNHSGSRQYLHAYSDALPQIRFLEVRLHQRTQLRGVGATFYLHRPRGISNATWSLLTSHFERLHLLKRYNKLGNDEIAEILSTCRAFVDAGGASAQNFLQELASNERAVHGDNHWRAALMSAMAADPSLLTWI